MSPIEAIHALREALEPATAARLETASALEAAVATGLARARAAWPGLAPGADLMRLVAAGLAPDELAPEAIAGRRWEDLALLDGFRRRHEPAVALMTGTIAGRAADALVEQGAGRDVASDVVHERLTRLLGPIARIGYAGRGSFAGWFRRCALHDWRNFAAREARLTDDASLEVALIGDDPEAALVAGVHGAVFRQALMIAFAEGLDEEERRLLRMIHIDGLSARQVGAVLGLHRVTVQRRIAGATERLREHTLRVLRQRFGLAEREISTLIRSLLGRFEVTLSRLLPRGEDPAG